MRQAGSESRCRHGEYIDGLTLEEATRVDLRDSVWIAGCERCRSHLLWLCAKAGFTPRISYATCDMVVLQSQAGRRRHGSKHYPRLARALKTPGIGL